MTTTLKTALFTKLKTAASGASNRIYATIAPQDVTAPYVVFTQISSNDIASHDGYASLMQSRYQIACYATTAKAAQDLADSVVDGLRDWTSVQASFKDGVVDGFEPNVGPNGESYFNVMVDFLFWHSA